jgi:hypothetical protein
LRSILYKLAQKNQAMLQIAFIRESKKVINALAKEIWKPKVVLKSNTTG